jgi:lipopolysaccharide export system protein LptA
VTSFIHHSVQRTSRALLAAAMVLGVALPMSMAPAQAQAQQNTQRQMSSLALSNDAPIQIESDRLEVSEQTGIATFTGNVNVVQGETLLKSGEMIVHYSNDGGSASTGTAAIERIDLSGKVFLQSGTQTATGDRGSFNMVSEVLELTGERVVLSEGDNVLVGCKLTVQVQSGNALLESCGNRVSIQLNPNSRPSGQ